MPEGNLHEDLRREDRLAAGSNRSFGFVFAAAFAVIGAWPLVRGLPPRWWAFGVAAAFLVAALAAPSVLRPLNIAWFRLGLLINKVVSPLVMLALFYGTVTPVAAIARWMGKDMLRLRRRPDLGSYWIAREPPGPPPETLKNQF